MFKNFTFVLSILIIGILSTSTFAQGWIQLTSVTSSNLNAVHFINDNTGYIVGDDQTVLKTTDGGTTFQVLTTGVTGDYFALYFFDENTGVVTGSGGLIIRTTDGGSTWSEVSSGVTYTLYSVSFNGDNGIAGGAAQTIITSSDAGQSWTVYQTDFFGGGFFGAHMVSSGTGYLGGENSIFQPLLAKTTNGGTNFSFTPFYLNSNEGELHDVYFTDETNGFSAARVWTGEGAVSKSTDGGNNWSTIIFNNSLNSIFFPSSSVGYTAGYNGDILKTEDGGVTWNYQTSGVGVELFDVYFITELTGYSVGESGTILKTSQGGEIPVELTSFTANVIDDKVKLEWTTATETNNQGFEVQRKISSSEDNQWVQIDFVEGNGTTTETQNYSFVDEEITTGNYSYRLKQIDYDGNFEYSNVIEIDIDQIPDKYSLEQNYPNPFNPTTTIKYTIPEIGLRSPLERGGRGVSIKLIIYDILGNEVATLVNEEKEPGNYTVEFNGTGLASGTYFYSMQAGDFVSIKKMILLK